MKIYNTGKKVLLWKMYPIINALPTGAKILDIGCGTGDLTRYLADKYTKLNIIGIDIHKETLNYANQFKQKNLQYILGNGKTIPLKDNSIDFIYSTSVIEHIEDDKKFVKEVNRVLKDDSFFIVTTLNRDVVPFKDTNPDHKRHYTLKELNSLLNSGGFNVIRVEYSWPRIGRNIDIFLDNYKKNIFHPKTFQPCITALPKKEKESSKFKLLISVFNIFFDPILSVITFLDYKLNGNREKFNMILICQKTDNKTLNPIAQQNYKTVLNLLSTKNKNFKILDAGCGNGELSKRLSNSGFKVFACDIENKIINNKTIKYKKTNLNKKLSYENDFFNIIICLEVIEHIENPWLLIREFYRTLNKNGILIISSPNISNCLARVYMLLTGKIWLFKECSTDHINPITYWELERILKDMGFNNIEIINGVNVINNVTMVTNIKNPFIKKIYYIFFKSWDLLHDLFNKKNLKSKSLFKSFSYIISAHK